MPTAIFCPNLCLKSQELQRAELRGILIFCMQRHRSFFPDILHVESSPVSHLVLYIISQKQLVEALELMLFSHYSVTAGISTKFPSFNPHLYLSLIKK